MRSAIKPFYFASTTSRYSFHVDEVGERELGGAAAGRGARDYGGGSGGAARRDGPHANVPVAVDEAAGEAVGEACITRSD